MVVGFDNGGPCITATKIARSPDGECWAFPGGCSPEGWEEGSDGFCPMSLETCPEN